MKRLFFLFAVVLGACVIGTTTHAQFTNNPSFDASGNPIVKTTNVTSLVPIGNGFGVAILGVGLPEYNPNPPSVSSNYLFFATPMGQPCASDATVSNGVYQFYVASTDQDSANGNKHADYFAYKVSSSLTSPTSLTIVRTWLARVETNNVGSPQAGSLAACGISKDGTTVLRADSSSSPNGSASSQAVFVFNAETNTTVVITQVLANASFATSCLITQVGPNTLKYGSLGMNQDLFAGNTFGNTTYVGRVNITTTDPQLYPHSQLIDTNENRSAAAINDTAKVLAYWTKTGNDDVIGCGDVCTHLSVVLYTDTGSGNITITNSTIWTFGNPTGTDCGNFGDTVNTNAIDYFGATAFNGPPQISINDHGDMAFPISENCYIQNTTLNGTRNATVCGILWKDKNTGTFREVVNNQNTALFAPASYIPPAQGISYETNNLVSPPVLDDYGNIFFACGLTNYLAGGTNAISDTYLFWSAPNTYPPTSWTTRPLLGEDNSFVEPTMGWTNRIDNLPMVDFSSSGQANVPRSFGANSIIRTPFPGTTNQLGGVVVCATMTNLTSGLRYDAVLYIAPMPYVPFAITSIARSGNDVIVAWNGQPGSNVVQAATGGNFATNNFADLATVVCSGYSVTNYTHTNGATGSANRYYRIKLLQ